MSVLVLALSVALVSQTTEDLICQLGSDEYSVREHAHKVLEVRVRENFADCEQVRLSQNHDDLEIRYRCRRLFQGKYLLMFVAGEYPIWSIPDKYRFVKNEDIALSYYLKAYQSLNPDRSWTHYNHHPSMLLATRLYFFDCLNNQKSDMLGGLARSIKVNYEKEMNLCNETDFYCCPVFAVPSSLKCRIFELHEGLERDSCFMPKFVFQE